jgi:hypothetical protein
MASLAASRPVQFAVSLVPAGRQDLTAKAVGA